MNEHISAPATDWIYEKPERNGKMQLLTIGGISVTGSWRGELGEFYFAWAPLLRRNKAREAEIREINGNRFLKKSKREQRAYSNLCIIMGVTE